MFLSTYLFNNLHFQCQEISILHVFFFFFLSGVLPVQVVPGSGLQSNGHNLSREGDIQCLILSWKQRLKRGRYNLRAIYNSGHIRFVSIDNFFGDFPELSIYNFFVFNLGLDCLCIATLCIFLQQLWMVLNAERVKPTAPCDRY